MRKGSSARSVAKDVQSNTVALITSNVVRKRSVCTSGLNLTCTARSSSSDAAGVLLP